MKKLIVLASTTLGVLSLMLLLTLLSVGPSSAAPLPEDHPLDGADGAHIVVQFGPGEQVVRTIQFTAPISGLAALQMSGLEIVTQDFDWGIAVCSIGGVGCPVDDCFCSSKYWGYEYWDGSAWQGYLVGAPDSSISNGAVEGWRWGEFGSGALPPAPPLLAARKGLDWLAAQQEADSGGFGSATNAVEALLTFGANGMQASEQRLEASSPSLLQYWMGGGPAYGRKGAAESGKLATGLVAADACLPPLTQTPKDYYSATSGIYDPEPGFNAWGILGAAAMSETIPGTASDYLKSQVQADGGWEWNAGFGSDTNTTALAIQALLTTGESPTATVIVEALNFLEKSQNTDGGFPYDPDSPWGTDSDTNSTAYAVQAILATGGDPLTGTWVISHTNPISYLLGMQMPEGSFEWQAGFGANMVATEQAITALLGRTLPYRVADLPHCSSAFMPIVTKVVTSTQQTP